MNLRSSIIILTVVLLLSGPARAGETGNGATETKKPAKQRLVCKQEVELGTHMAKRVCKTWEAWKKQDEATTAMAQHFLDKASEQASAAGAIAAGAGPGGK